VIFSCASRKSRLAFWFDLLALLLLLSSCTSANNGGLQDPALTPLTLAPGSIAPPFDTWNNVHIFQTFDYNISNAAGIAHRYDFVWGAQAGNIAAYRTGNPHISLSFYIPFNRDWGVFPDSNRRYSLRWWQAQHQDWILYRCDRVTPAYYPGYPNVPLDFTNPAVRAWQIRAYAQPASASGYDAIAADNIIFQNYAGACGVLKNGRWMQLYSGQPNDSRWRADIINWLRQMQQALHSLPHPLALITNFYVGNAPFSDSQVQQIANYSDGLLDEDGFTLSGRGYLTDRKWLQRVLFMQSVQQQHKPYYVIDLSPAVGRLEIQWDLASYLMGKGHSAALCVTPIGEYGSTQLYNEYNAQIGHPLGPMYRAQNIYVRSYSHGLSIVNASSTNTYTLTLSAAHHYIDLYGNAVARTLTMPPHSGMVLLLQA
jgi:hypothetical protein